MPPLPKPKPAPAARASARAAASPRKGNAGGRSFGGGSGFFPKLNPTLRPPRKLDSGDVAGFGMGLVLYVLVLRVIQDGPEGPVMWLRAKFLNQTTVAAAPSKTERG